MEDISGGIEALPIPVINEVDDSGPPEGLTYIRDYQFAPYVEELVWGGGARMRSVGGESEVSEDRGGRAGGRLAGKMEGEVEVKRKAVPKPRPVALSPRPVPHPVELTCLPPLHVQVAPLLAAEDQRMFRFTGGTCGLAYNRKVVGAGRLGSESERGAGRIYRLGSEVLAYDRKDSGTAGLDAEGACGRDKTRQSGNALRPGLAAAAEALCATLPPCR